MALINYLDRVDLEGGPPDDPYYWLPIEVATEDTVVIRIASTGSVLLVNGEEVAEVDYEPMLGWCARPYGRHVWDDYASLQEMVEELLAWAQVMEESIEAMTWD